MHGNRACTRGIGYGGQQGHEVEHLGLDGDTQHRLDLLADRGDLVGECWRITLLHDLDWWQGCQCQALLLHALLEQLLGQGSIS